MMAAVTIEALTYGYRTADPALCAALRAERNDGGLCGMLTHLKTQKQTDVDLWSDGWKRTMASHRDSRPVTVEKYSSL